MKLSCQPTQEFVRTISCKADKLIERKNAHRKSLLPNLRVGDNTTSIHSISH